MFPLRHGHRNPVSDRVSSTSDGGEDASPRANLENRDSELEQIESSPRAISTGQLHALPRFHVPPIDLVVFQGPYLVSQWEASSPGELRT